MKDFIPHTVQIEGRPASYLKREGKKQTVLFLHGLGIDHRIWEQTISFFDSGITVILLDLPGYGLNVDLRINPSFDSITHFIEGFIHEIKTVDSVVSYSLSGVYGYEIVKRSRVTVNKMFIISAPLFDSVDPIRYKRVFRFISCHSIITTIINFLIVRFPLKQLIFYIGQLASLKNPKTMNKCMTFFYEISNSSYVYRSASEVFRQTHLELISSPVEFIYGQKDGFATVAMAQKAVNLCRRGSLNVINDIYHLAPFESPKQLATIIQSGLN